jgi:hypothetical protein
MSEAPPPRRRWFQFGIGTMFFAVTVLAALAAFLAYHVNWVRERRNAPVYYVMEEVYLVTPSGPKPTRVACDAPWPLEWFGEPGCNALQISPSVPESEVERIRRLFPEAEIEILSPEEELEQFPDMSPQKVLAAGQAFREWAKAADPAGRLSPE